MHRLNRPTPPACLGRYRHGRDNWNSVKREDRSEIWTQLDQMQQRRCAYCEAALDTENERPKNGHIEHFRQRDHFPAETFAWQNLFGSCNRAESCGKHKDGCGIHPGDLIKPDEEDPEYFLRYLPDGQVMPAEHLTKVERRRAEATIDAFNLNGVLRHIRRRHLEGYRSLAEELTECALEWDEPEWRELLDLELAAIVDKPHMTAIRQLLDIA